MASQSSGMSNGGSAAGGGTGVSGGVGTGDKMKTRKQLAKPIHLQLLEKSLSLDGLLHQVDKMFGSELGLSVDKQSDMDLDDDISSCSTNNVDTSHVTNTPIISHTLNAQQIRSAKSRIYNLTKLKNSNKNKKWLKGLYLDASLSQAEDPSSDPYEAPDLYDPDSPAADKIIKELLRTHKMEKKMRKEMKKEERDLIESETRNLSAQWLGCNEMTIRPLPLYDPTLPSNRSSQKLSLLHQTTTTTAATSAASSSQSYSSPKPASSKSSKLSPSSKRASPTTSSISSPRPSKANKIQIQTQTQTPSCQSVILEDNHVSSSPVPPTKPPSSTTIATSISSTVTSISSIAPLATSIKLEPVEQPPTEVKPPPSEQPPPQPQASTLIPTNDPLIASESKPKFSVLKTESNDTLSSFMNLNHDITYDTSLPDEILQEDAPDSVDDNKPGGSFWPPSVDHLLDQYSSSSQTSFAATLSPAKSTVTPVSPAPSSAPSPSVSSTFSVSSSTHQGPSKGGGTRKKKKQHNNQQQPSPAKSVEDEEAVRRIKRGMLWVSLVKQEIPRAASNMETQKKDTLTTCKNLATWCSQKVKSKELNAKSKSAIRGQKLEGPIQSKDEPCTTTTKDPVEPPASTSHPVQKPEGKSPPIETPASTSPPVELPASTSPPVELPASTSPPAEPPASKSPPVLPSSEPSPISVPVSLPAAVDSTPIKVETTPSPPTIPANNTSEGHQGDAMDEEMKEMEADAPEDKQPEQKSESEVGSVTDIVPKHVIKTEPESEPESETVPTALSDSEPRQSECESEPKSQPKSEPNFEPETSSPETYSTPPESRSSLTEPEPEPTAYKQDSAKVDDSEKFEEVTMKDETEKISIKIEPSEEDQPHPEPEPMKQAVEEQNPLQTEEVTTIKQEPPDTSELA